MEEKEDGRMYSRIMRRCVAVINHLNQGETFSINDIASEIHDKKLPEFYLERFNRQMSVMRTKDYIRYLVEIDVVSRDGDKYYLKFQHKTRDEEWAQELSDLALLHLAKALKKSPPEVVEYLEDLRNDFHSKSQLPTLDEIAEKSEISGNREQEYFRWSLYMFADVDTSPFDIRRYPVLVKQGT